MQATGCLKFNIHEMPTLFPSQAFHFSLPGRQKTLILLHPVGTIIGATACLDV